MISYAISMGCVGDWMTPQLEAAFRKAKLRRTELSFLPYTKDTEQSRDSAARTRTLLEQGVLLPGSVHLPFYGGGLNWDPSDLREEERKAASRRFQNLIVCNAPLMAPEVTLHPGLEVPLEEHPARIQQSRKTLEEMLGLAEKMRFRINVEYLPRTCVGNSPEELLALVEGFPEERIGICLDVNHTMNHAADLPEIIRKLGKRIHAFHISDYDNVDEMHWYPGQGIIDWIAVMREIRKMDHDVLLILENVFQLGEKISHVADPIFGIRQVEGACWFLENCERIMPEIHDFQIPGNPVRSPAEPSGKI